MRKQDPTAVSKLSAGCGSRLHFYMRDFIHSEIADFCGVPNIPEQPDFAIGAGRRLCEELFEPLQATSGRLAIRSA